MSQSADVGWRDAGRLVRGDGFRRLVTGQALGQGADGLAEIAFAQVALFDVGAGATPARIAGVLAVTLLPFTLIGPFAGVLIDRWDRRRVLVTVSLVRVAIAVGAVFVVAARSEALAYVGILALLSSSRFLLAAKGAALPRTVPSSDLVPANALSAIAGMVTAFAGAVIGSLFVQDLPEGGFAIAAVLYLLAAAQFRLLPPVGGGSPVEDVGQGLRRVARELADGARAITRDRQVGVPLLAVWTFRLLLGAGFIMLVLIGESRYGLEARGYGTALAVTGLGAFLGTWAAPPLAARFRPVALLPVAFAVAGVATLIGGFSPTLGVLIAGVGVVAVAFQVLKIVVDALVGGATDDLVRGRVFATYDILYNLAFIVAGLALIPVWDPDRVTTLLWVLAGGFVVSALAFARTEREWPFAASRRPRAAPTRPAHRWRARVAAFALAAPIALAFPAPAWWWWAWCALVPLLLVVRAAPTGREAGLRAWWGGTGFMLAMHHWLVPSLGPFIVPIAALLGLLWLPWGRLVHATLRDLSTVRRLLRAVVLVPAGWVVIEAVRSWERAGGPWGLLGASQWNTRPLLAAAALGGVWLVSALVVGANVGLAAVFTPGTTRRVRIAAIVLAVGAMAVGPVWSLLRPPLSGARTARIALVQPGVMAGPTKRFDLEVRLTRALAPRRVDLVVWGESSVGFDLDRRPDLRALLERTAQAVGAPLLVNVDARRAGAGGIYKSSVLVTEHGVAGRYDKIRLVPFGEYVPLRWLFSWTTSVTKAAQEDRRRGTDLRVLHAGTLAIGPLVCFESAFPDMSRNLARRDVDLVIVQSATSTFQDSWAPMQHASLAAVRAVETGRPVVHATLTGVSTVFDATGRLQARLDVDERAARIVLVPLARTRTPYVVLGDWVPALSFAVLLLAGAATTLRRARSDG